MIGRLINWLWGRRRVARYNARALDAKLLWPSLHRGSAGEMHFLYAAALHTSLDPNWRGHEDEWRNTPVDPSVWVSLQPRREVF